jgi:fatty aldehyde-generating acyl-ACP reductase
MKKFGFVMHPTGVDDVRRFFFPSMIAPASLIEAALKALPPFVMHHIRDISSVTGEKIEGFFIICPLTSKQFMELDEEFVLEKVLAAVRLSERKGSSIIGLGALAGGTGRGGEKIAEKSALPVTNGTSLASATILETVFKAAELKKIPLKSAKAVIAGATNAIGQTCAHALAQRVAFLDLYSKSDERLQQLRTSLTDSPAQVCITGRDFAQSVAEADIIIFTTTAVEVSFKATTRSFKENAVICDVPAPRNVSKEVAEARKDILVMDGALLTPPCPIKLRIEHHLPEGLVYACMAETMTLTMEQRFREDYSLGFVPNLQKVEEIARLAKKHGFHTSFTSFGEPVKELCR